MADRVDIDKHPYGLGGGTYLSGSGVSASVDAFMYYPVTNCTATIRFTNITNGTAAVISASAGVPVYGSIAAVTQSSGVSIVYNGITSNPYTF
jgi:hypothetical protein